ncbi:hypothetical protein ON010_g11784 [Phytophthora cinnamomi]|nr:hypothetical protein ON010_g11784 [Phytophthora cinnamomi]
MSRGVDAISTTLGHDQFRFWVDTTTYTQLTTWTDAVQTALDKAEAELLEAEQQFLRLADLTAARGGQHDSGDTEKCRKNRLALSPIKSTMQKLREQRSIEASKSIWRIMKLKPLLASTRAAAPRDVERAVSRQARVRADTGLDDEGTEPRIAGVGKLFTDVHKSTTTIPGGYALLQPEVALREVDRIQPKEANVVQMMKEVQGVLTDWEAIAENRIPVHAFSRSHSMLTHFGGLGVSLSAWVFRFSARQFFGAANHEPKYRYYRSSACLLVRVFEAMPTVSTAGQVEVALAYLSTMDRQGECGRFPLPRTLSRVLATAVGHCNLASFCNFPSTDHFA